MDGNILANKSAADRPSTDFYPTPQEVTIALLNHLRIPKGATIWEPACGQGHMAYAIKSAGYNVLSSDINDFGYGETGSDFLTCEPKETDWIITNPPFNLSVDFIKRCINHGKPFALLLKSQYWHSAKRAAIFKDYPPKSILALTWRPDFLFGKKGGAPTMECIWTVWDPQNAEQTRYQLLDKPK